ncbi:MAG: thiamine pyrophosphate-dependent enzyme, partial [Acidobacteriota bacterium]
MTNIEATTVFTSTPYSRDEALADYRLGWRSRHTSLLGRREVLTGKAKFGIFGDGKELAQIAMARAFGAGDIRSGYYRDQTVMMALDLLDVEGFFAQLYADPDVEREPASAGRQMNGHFATRVLDDQGLFIDQTTRPQSAADTSPTGSQMPRLVGLAYASRLYRDLDSLRTWAETAKFSRDGNEIAWGTIGNASCAEGMFWEAVNAIGVLGAPAVISIWDDEYGISVPNEFQITKGDLSAVLSGFQREPGSDRGFDIYRVNGWDYEALRRTYAEVAERVRREHVPAIVHVVELTQPQGHSTSGSHERYKSAERLAWEREHDCLAKLRGWLIDNQLADAAELDAIEQEEKKSVREAQRRAWDAFMAPILADKETLLGLVDQIAEQSAATERIANARRDLGRLPNPVRRNLLVTAREVLFASRDEDIAARQQLIDWQKSIHDAAHDRYHSHLYSESPLSALRIEAVDPTYDADATELNGFEVLTHCFDAALARHPNLLAFGEDLGKLGDVNQGFAGLQEKYGATRVADVGIRECTILGQAIGMAMRGLKPIAEVQYLDYLPYALQIISDDLATLQYRTRGGQKAPVIIRTRGHRFEGIWHAGSPMAGIINLVHGVH